MPDDHHRYLLGDDRDELSRLTAQHTLWMEQTAASWRRAGFGPGQHLLDIGAGPGLCTRELAHWVGVTGHVTALDQSAAFIGHIQQIAADEQLDNVSAVQADLASAPLAAQGFDGAYARWVFCFLRDPEAAVQRIANWLKPGAPLVTLDYFNYGAFRLSTESEAMTQVVAGVQKAWTAQGGSLQVQGAMPQLMANAGLQVSCIEQVSGVAPMGSARADWPKQFLTSFVPQMIAAGTLSEATGQQFWRDWRNCERSGGYVYLPPLIEIHGRRPEQAD